MVYRLSAKMAGSFGNDIWKNWDKNGKQEFIKTCIPLLKDETRNPVLDKSGKPTNIIKYVNELVDKGIKGVIKKESVVSTLQELVTLHPDIPSIILDVLNLEDANTSLIDSEDSKDRSNFCAIVKECEKFLSDKLLKERLEIDTLQEVGVLKNNSFYSKFIKVKTKLYYKQRKFNLFREECEGFAKLVTELANGNSESTSPEELISIVQSLIGCFNLDPNRVLDVILESFENKPNEARIFVPLINYYMNDPRIISEVLSTKFAFLKNNEQSIPQSLYVLTAQLLQHGIIKLEDIYYWLYPEDKVLVKECEKDMKVAREYVRKLQVISLNNKEKEGSPEEPDTDNDKYVGNQKLGLCEALLMVGDWESAKILIKSLPDRYAVGYEPIAISLCGLIHHIIEPVYREYGVLSSKIPRKPTPPHDGMMVPKQAETPLDLRQTAIPMLLMLGSSLRYDPVLLCKIVRMAKAILASYGIDNAKSPPPNCDSLYNDILSLVDETILPALSYLDCNCCIAEEIWTLLKLYPYQIRYCLYSRWKNETYNLYPELLRKRADSEKQIKNIMKRVSKENVKPVGRLIGKLTHCSPGFLFDYVLLQIQVYNNLINPVVDSLKYLTNLSYDVLGFCLIESLANAEKKRVKHDSTSISTWLQSLSSFCGAVYKKYTIELTGLLQFVANQLKAQKSLDLLILKEVVQKMAGVDAAEDLTMDQLNALAGGELLKSEAGYFSQVRNTKKSSLRLKEAMAENDLAVALCLLMAQQNYCVVYKETQKSHLKLVGKLSDQCQDTLVQFGTFLGSTLSVEEYINKLPSIQSMLIDYHIPLEVAFFLARPMFNHAINQRYDQIRKSDPNYKKMSSSLKNQKYVEAINEIMEPVHTSLIPLHPHRVWEDISPQFLSTFWSLTMYDLYVPEDVYLQVINKVKTQSLLNLESGIKGKKEQERYQTLFEKLQDEKKKQSEHVDKIMYRLKQEKDNWFVSKSAKVAKNEAITRFLQLCIFPRCTFTQIDAVYCAKFVHTIHLLKTPNFSTLLFYDRVNDTSKEKEKVEKRTARQVPEDTRTTTKNQVPSVETIIPISKERVEKSHKDEQPKEKHRTEKKDDPEKERDRDKRRERREEKTSNKEDRQDRHDRQYSRLHDDRYALTSPKEDARHSSEKQVDRYYDERSSGGHYYRETRDERELASGGSINIGRLSQEPEPERDNKRRKIDNSSKNSKHEERKVPPLIDFPIEKDKRERAVKPKEKREKLTEEEKELRKERKLGRKRDRIDEAMQQEMKRRREEDKNRREEEKAFKMMTSPNGEIIEPPIHPGPRDKHHRTREISPYQRDRSHEKSEPRDKHRRSSENKRR
nr:THO complex subunit 2 [Leptinotarsa decemlineata]